MNINKDPHDPNELDIIQEKQAMQIPQEERPKLNKKVKKSKYKSAFLNYFKSSIGSGVLALPYAFQQCGCILGPISFILIYALNTYCQQILLDVHETFKESNQNNPDSEEKEEEEIGYIEMILKVKGQNYVRFIGVVYSLSCIGAAVSYTLFFIEFFEMALYHVDHPPLQREIIYLCLSLCIVVPASFIDNLALFAKLSNIANVLVVYSFSAIMIFSLANTEEVTIKYFDISNITTMIGVVLYAYINPVSTLAFKLVMRNQGQFRRLTLVTNLTVFTTYLIFSLVSSIKYGDQINQIVLFSLPKNNFFASFAQMGYAISLSITYPLVLLPSYHIIEKRVLVNWVKSLNSSLNYQIQDSKIKKMGQRLFQILIASLVSLLAPQFAVFLSLIGGLTGLFTVFWMPFLLYQERIAKNQNFNKKRANKNYLFYALTGIGIVASIVTIIQSIIKLFQG